MIGKFTGAMIGRRLARRAGGSGMLGAAAGIGVSILLRRVAPLLGRAAVRQAQRLAMRGRSGRAVDRDTR